MTVRNETIVVDGNMMEQLVFNPEMRNTLLIDIANPILSTENEGSLQSTLGISLEQYNEFVKPIIVNKESGSQFLEIENQDSENDRDFYFAAHWPYMVEMYEPEDLAPIFPYIFPFLSHEGFQIATAKISSSEEKLISEVLKNCYEDLIPVFIDKLEVASFEKIGPGTLHSLQAEYKDQINHDRLNYISDLLGKSSEWLFEGPTDFSTTFKPWTPRPIPNAWGKVIEPNQWRELDVLPSGTWTRYERSEKIPLMCVSKVDQEHYMYQWLGSISLI